MFGAAQVPQLSEPPQPSAAVPQLKPSFSQVVGVQPFAFEGWARREKAASAIALICPQSMMSACSSTGVLPCAATRSAVRFAPSTELR